MLERPDSYAGLVRTVLLTHGPSTRKQIRAALPHLAGKVVDNAVQGLHKKRKLAVQVVPMLFADGSTRRCFVYSLKAPK